MCGGEEFEECVSLKLPFICSGKTAINETHTTASRYRSNLRTLLTNNTNLSKKLNSKNLSKKGQGKEKTAGKDHGRQQRAGANKDPALLATQLKPRWPQFVLIQFKKHKNAYHLSSFDYVLSRVQQKHTKELKAPDKFLHVHNGASAEVESALFTSSRTISVSVSTVLLSKRKPLGA